MESDDIPRPEDYVPRWPNGTPKDQRFWTDVDRAQDAAVKRTQAEWDERQPEEPAPTPKKKRR